MTSSSSLSTTITSLTSVQIGRYLTRPPPSALECVRGEGVQGVLNLFCSGAAQVCHDLRVVVLREQLEVEEEDGDRQEEEEEVEREKRGKEVRK